MSIFGKLVATIPERPILNVSSRRGGEAKVAQIRNRDADGTKDRRTYAMVSKGDMASFGALRDS